MIKFDNNKREKWMSTMFYNTLIFFSLTLSLVLTTSVHSASLSTQQQRYLDAREALNQQNMTLYKELRGKLNDYPLTPYLDFHANMDTLLTASGKQALEAIEQFKGMPIYQTTRHRYLVNAGEKKHWQDFLTMSPSLPNNIELQCYFYRAKLSQKQTEVAYKGARQLWLYGRSRPKECDPLFASWKEAGHQTQELIWDRMLLTFNNSQSSLLRFLAKQITDNKEQAELLVSVYNNPNSLKNNTAFMNKANGYADIVEVGIKRLARNDIDQAVTLFLQYEKAERFSHFQAKKLQAYLMRRALIRQQTSQKDFIDQRLAKVDSDDLTIMRLRWAIRENDQQTVNQFLPTLSPETQNKARWQYWLSQSQVAGIDKDNILKNLAKQRNFYGFLAADLLKQKIQLQHVTTQPDKQISDTLNQDPGLARVIELRAIDKLIDARAEWVMLLARHSKATQAQYALLAQKKQWHDLAVQASIQGQLWNDMDLRFPYPEEKIFANASKKNKVDIDEIRAISRRESAFYPYATSGVGARGMMQIMPATAKNIAKQMGLKYEGPTSLYDESFNIQLGSYYYASLLKRFNNNRVLATAAYNAGPNRINPWLEKTDGKLDVVAFIESIPFRETREYVQAVYSYRMIYQSRENKKTDLFSKNELNFKY